MKFFSLVGKKNPFKLYILIPRSGEGGRRGTEKLAKIYNP